MHLRAHACFLLLMIGWMPCRAQVRGWDSLLNIGLLHQSSGSGRFDDMYFFDKDTGLVVTGTGVIMKTVTACQFWDVKEQLPFAVPYDKNYLRSIEFSDENQVGIVGTLGGKVLRSRDRGETWTDIQKSVPDTGLDARHICGLAHHGNTFYGVGWYGGTIARFYKSHDTGATWTVSYIDSNLASGLVDIVWIQGTTLFASGFHKFNGTKQESVVIKSTDDGAHWMKVFSDTVISGRIWKLQFLTPSLAYGSIEPLFKDTVAIIRSKDGGDHWQIVPVASDADTSGKPLQTQGVGFINPAHGWVGGYYYGMYETLDSGATWKLTYPSSYRANRFFRLDSLTMYVSGYSVYRYSDTGAAANPSPVPTPPSGNFLYPVFPNPSKNAITIRFDLSKGSNVLLEIVDLAGRNTYKVASGYYKAGHYEIKWNGSALANGLYMAWLGTDDIPLVQKFLLGR